ncbi:MAG: hypothetical protein RIQ99_109 [Pseudomonadota bacterium]
MSDTSQQAGQQQTTPVIPDGRLKALMEALNNRTQNPGKCRSCERDGVTIAPHMVSPLLIHDGGTLLGGTTYPQIMLICGYCGETRYHNVVALEASHGDNGVNQGDR